MRFFWKGGTFCDFDINEIMQEYGESRQSSIIIEIRGIKKKKRKDKKGNIDVNNENENNDN